MAMDDGSLRSGRDIEAEAASRAREPVLRLDVAPPRLTPLRDHAVEEAIRETRSPGQGSRQPAAR